MKKKLEEESENKSTICRIIGTFWYNEYGVHAALSEDEQLLDSLFNQMLFYWEQTLEDYPNDFEANFTIGSIYFNKAANELKKLNVGLCRTEELKYYQNIKEKSDKLFQKALPYFQNAESTNPNDPNTLIALSEIYARLGDYEKVIELKKGYKKSKKVAKMKVLISIKKTPSLTIPVVRDCQRIKNYI